MNARIRIHLALAAAALATLGLAGTAAAQTFPSKPVTLMVPYPAGGLSDVIARSVNNTLGKQLGQPVIVENLGGASGSIAAAKVLNGPSDGYTIFQGSPNELILAPLAISSIKFKSEDFRLVQMIATAQIAFLAKKDLPVNSVDEFVEHARKAAGFRTNILICVGAAIYMAVGLVLVNAGESEGDPARIAAPIGRKQAGEGRHKIDTAIILHRFGQILNLRRAVDQL